MRRAGIRLAQVVEVDSDVDDVDRANTILAVYDKRREIIATQISRCLILFVHRFMRYERGRI
jgi:hypothetical protein